MTGRSLFRVLRWVGMAAVIPVLWACQARNLEEPKLKPEMTYGKNFQQTINRNVDMLFLVDDSSSMRLTQDNLNTNFPSFMNRLMEPPGLPNIHVAVISSDMGAGDGSVASCDSTGGKQGIFQYTARGACTSTGLEAGATYISDIAGTRNYTGALPDVFTCIAALGEGGCGFEHQFASMLRALGADGPGPVGSRPAPAENQGFLRKDAYLVIVMITNEDDCSASPNVPLFDTGSNTNIGSQLGPPANFRCNEFGHVCNDAAGMPVHPSRIAPNADVAATVMYSSCRSNDQEGYLLSVQDTADRIKALKGDASQVIVAAITGPATPYTVNWKAPSTADTSCGAASCPWPVIAHSCTAPDGSFADPSVRVGEFVQQFGANGALFPICADSFAGSLDRIAALINASLQPPCINSPVARKAGGTEFDCTVVSHTTNSSTGGTIDATVPACSENGGVAPCWQLTAGGMGCNGGQIVNVSNDPTLPTSTAQNATVNCALCDPNFPDPNRMCN